MMEARWEEARLRREARAIPSGVVVSTFTYLLLSNSKTCRFYVREKQRCT